MAVALRDKIFVMNRSLSTSATENEPRMQFIPALLLMLDTKNEPWMRSRALETLTKLAEHGAFPSSQILPEADRPPQRILDILLSQTEYSNASRR
jgi:hypothetical protein